MFAPSAGRVTLLLTGCDTGTVAIQNTDETWLAGAYLAFRCRLIVRPPGWTDKHLRPPKATYPDAEVPFNDYVETLPPEWGGKVCGTSGVWCLAQRTCV